MVPNGKKKWFKERMLWMSTASRQPLRFTMESALENDNWNLCHFLRKHPQSPCHQNFSLFFFFIRVKYCKNGLYEMLNKLSCKKNYIKNIFYYLQNTIASCQHKVNIAILHLPYNLHRESRSTLLTATPPWQGKGSGNLQK